MYWTGSPEAPPASPSPTPVFVETPSPNPSLVEAPDPQLDDSGLFFPQPVSKPIPSPPLVFSPPPPSPPPPQPSPVPSPLPATILPSPTKPSPSPSPSPNANNPPSLDEVKAPKKKPPPPPPPSKNSSPSTKSSGSVSTTTIIIAVAAGVGGLIALVIITSIWCSCRKNKKAATAATADKQGGGDIEAGGMHMNGHDSKYYSSDMEQKMSAADVYKSELRAQQFQQLQQHQPARAARTASAKSQLVPLSVLDPSDLATGYSGAPTMLNTTGPLAAGVSTVTGGAVIAVAATASALSGGARSTGASPTKSRPTATASRSRSTMSEAAMPAASHVTQEEQEHNDALLTWIGGQLSREKEMEVQQMQHRMAVTGNTGAAIQKVPTLASRQQQQLGQRTTMNPSPSRARFDDVSAYAIDFDTLHMGRNIGEGSFGKVYLAVWNETPVAVKVLVDSSSALDRKLDDPMRLRRLAAPVLDKLAEEAGLMASMRHPNIIQFMGIVSMPPCVVTEFCERGSLTDVLKKARKGVPGAVEALGWRLRLSMAADAAKGMLYLHARPQPIIHRDLKSPNLLVDSHWRVKVCDFNMSRIMEESGQGSSLAGTNPRWLAPELLSGEHATTYSDVFAFGVVLWELLTFELPWFKDNPWSVAHTVGNGGRLTIPNRWDLPGLDTNQFSRLDDYLDLMQRCWAQNPYDRPGFSEIIQDLKGMESSMPEGIEEYRASPAPSSGGGSFSRAHSHPNNVHAVPVVQGSPSISLPSAPSTVGPRGGGGGANRALVYPEYHGDYNNGELYADVTASMSSTAVAASIDPTGSFPQWQSRPGGWGSRRPGEK